MPTSTPRSSTTTGKADLVASLMAGLVAGDLIIDAHGGVIQVLHLDADKDSALIRQFRPGADGRGTTDMRDGVPAAAGIVIALSTLREIAAAEHSLVWPIHRSNP